MSTAKLSVNLLPEELLFEVLLRLPRRSLLRLRQVSKGLCNSIDSPLFRKRYDVFHNSVSDFSFMILEADHLFSMDFHLPPENLNSSPEKEVSIPHKKNPRFVGSSKGIICLMISPGPMFSFESYILLNPFNLTYQKVKCSNLYPFSFNFAIGFGYVYAKDDYKIVRLEPVEHGSVRYLDVYSWKTDSWKQVVVEFIPGCSAHVYGICVEGAIHWLWCLNKKDGYSCIAAFDLETETFRSLPLPPQLVDRQVWSIRDLGGRLCVLTKSLGSTVVWVMEVYGIGASWTRLVYIVNDMTFVVGYFPLWDSARLLCWRSDSRTLLWLNTEDGSKEDIQILKVPSQRGNNHTPNETKSWVCVRSPLRLRCSESQND